MDTLVSMRVFQQVAELGSFVRSAEKLRLSTAMTSKHIQHLEAHLGVRLFHRTSRRVRLTDEGQFYYSRCSEILNDLAETEAALSQASKQPKGLLRLAAPVWMCDQNFAELLGRYRERFPQVKLELELGDRMVDLVEEGIDLALRVTQEPHPTLLARRLCEIPFVLAASPAYLDRQGRPQDPQDLALHAMLVNSSQAHGQTLTYQTPTGLQHVALQAVMTTNSTHLIAQAAAAGMGLALLPGLILRQDSLASRLEQVLPELRLPAAFYLYAVYTSRRFQSPKVRSFIDFIVPAFQGWALGRPASG